MLFLPNPCHSLPFRSRCCAAQSRPGPGPEPPQRLRGGGRGTAQPARPPHGRACRAQHGGGAGPRPARRVLTGTRGGLGGGAIGRRPPSAPPGAARDRRERVAAAWPVGASGAGDGAGRERPPLGQPCRGTRSGAGPGAATARKRGGGSCAGHGLRRRRGRCGVCVRGTGRVLCGVRGECAEQGGDVCRMRCGCAGVCAGQGRGGYSFWGAEGGSVCRRVVLGQCGGGGTGIGVCRMYVGVGCVRRVCEGDVGLCGSQRGCKSICSGYLLFHWEKRELLRCAVRRPRTVPGLARLSPGPAGTPRPRRQSWRWSEFM